METKYSKRNKSLFKIYNVTIVHKSGLHSGVEHIPVKCVHKLRGGVERQDLGHEQLLAPLHFRCQVAGWGRGLGPLLQVTYITQTIIWPEAQHLDINHFWFQHNICRRDAGRESVCV